MNNIIERVNKLFKINIVDGQAISDDIPNFIIAENMEELIFWHEKSLKYEMLNPFSTKEEKEECKNLYAELLEYKKYVELMGIEKI